MKRRHSMSQTLLFKLGCCLCLSAALAACQNNTNVSSSDNRSASPAGRTQDNAASTTPETSDDSNAPTTPAAAERNSELCRKVESCDCGTYAQCMAAFENDPNIDQPGVRECMLKSSCQSLCTGKPDGCPKTGSSAGNPGGVPKPSNCAAIPCSSNSDCPTDCYGGCGDSRVCLSF